ncbi:coiled-coil domain-containing protein 106-like [Melanotaenia boesemani]|uniref:coiled-coil domain-containing protein 106-like n=1 Tax=Melanotaenia boesemani TaxID=1250792 RepID=UPI001C03D23F|nr:coiled-coil domain-containing protein 106-like [Melanotaenia boesemani]
MSLIDHHWSWMYSMPLVRCLAHALQMTPARILRLAFMTSSKVDETSRVDEETCAKNMPKANRKGVKTRATSEEMGSETADSEANSVSMAPTAMLVEKRRSQEIKILEMKVGYQTEKIEELTKERDFLKDQLASVLKKDTSSKRDTSSKKDSEDTISLSSDAASDSESSEYCSSLLSSDEEDQKKKKRKRTKTKVKKENKSKKTEEKDCLRAQTPNQVVSRYQRLLKLFRRSGTMAGAFKRYGVDRNTIVVTAPIAELSIAAPNKYREVLKTYNSQVKLCVFAAQCAFAITEDAEIEQLVKDYKTNGKLLPFKTK